MPGTDGSWVPESWALQSQPVTTVEQTSGGFPTRKKAKRDEEVYLVHTLQEYRSLLARIEADADEVVESQDAELVAIAPPQLEEIDRALKSRSLASERPYLEALIQYREIQNRRRAEKTLLLLALAATI